MAKGFFSRFIRSGPPEPLKPAWEPGPGAAADLPPPLPEIAREIVRRGLPQAPRKTAISLRLDMDVLEWFKGQGPGYQTRINAVLRAYKDAAG